MKNTIGRKIKSMKTNLSVSKIPPHKYINPTELLNITPSNNLNEKTFYSHLSTLCIINQY
jgi:hypothetical protein